MNSKLRKEAKDYFDSKIKAHGNIPQGVDWNSIEAQEIRFNQLSKVLPENNLFSIIDFGCGYGDLFKFLQKKNYTINSYIGIDISEAMLKAAKINLKDHQEVSFTSSIDIENVKPQEYVLASGIFNMKQSATEEEWLKHIKDSLHQINQLSTKGFAFNLLTAYSDEDKMRDDLFYGDPCFFFDYCKKHFSNNVSLLHDYDLYDFTIIVKKNLNKS